MNIVSAYIDSSESVQCLDEGIVIILASLARGGDDAHKQVLVRLLGRQALELVRVEISQRARRDPWGATPLLDIVLCRSKG